MWYLIWRLFFNRKLKNSDEPTYIIGPDSFQLYGSERPEPVVNVGAGTRVKLFTKSEFRRYYQNVELPWRRRMNEARAILRREKEE